MPTSTLRISYASFQADVEEDDQLYVSSDGSLHFQQGRTSEADVLIPLTPSQLAAQIEAFLTRTHLSPREPLVVQVEWSGVQENGHGNLFASRHRVTVSRYNPGETLRELRKRANLSQFQLAARSGITERAIRLIETGRTRSVRPETAAALAKTLNVGIADLRLPMFGGKGKQG